MTKELEKFAKKVSDVRPDLFGKAEELGGKVIANAVMNKMDRVSIDEIKEPSVRRVVSIDDLVVDPQTVDLPTYEPPYLGYIPDILTELAERAGQTDLSEYHILQKKRKRFDEWVDGGARGFARVASGLATGTAGAIRGQKYKTMGGLRRFPLSKESLTKQEELADKFRAFGDLMWEVHQHPDVAAQNTDMLSKILVMGAETVPFITATTIATITTGPFGGFAVGSMVEGNTAYRTALENDVPEEKAKAIGIGVGIVSGAIESVGGRVSDIAIAKIATRISNSGVRVAADLSIGSLSEAMEETFQEWSQIGGELQYRSVDYDEAVRRSIISAAGGGLLGGVFKTGSAAVRGISSMEGPVEGKAAEAEQAKAPPEEKIGEAFPRIDLTTLEGRTEAGKQATARGKEIAAFLGIEEDIFISVGEGKQVRGISHPGIGMVDVFAPEGATQDDVDEMLIHELGHQLFPKTHTGISGRYENEQKIEAFTEEKFAQWKAREKKARPVKSGEAKEGPFKGPKEPTGPGVSLLGGVPEPPPGLTRDEITALKSPVTKPAGLLRRAPYKLRKNEQAITQDQRTALKAKGYTLKEIARLAPKEAAAILEYKSATEVMREAQKKGWRVGYKMGVAANARKSRMTIDAIRLKGKMDNASRVDAMNMVLTFAPKERQGKYIRRILAANTPKRVDNIGAAINIYIKKAEKRQAKNDFKKFVRDTKREYRRGEVAFGKLPIATRERIQKVLDEYDLAKLSEGKAKTLESRDEFVKRISAELSDGFEAMNPEYDADAKDLMVMGKRRIDELKRLSKTDITELDADEIRYIHKSLEHLIKVNEQKGDSKDRRRAENLRTHLNNAPQEVLPPLKRVRYFTGIPGALGWAFKEGQASIESLVRMSTGRDAPATETLLVDNLESSNRERKGLYKQIVTHYRQAAVQKGVTAKDVAALNDRITVTLGGKKINISKAEALSIYAHTQATGNIERLLKTEGLNISTFYKGLGARFKYSWFKAREVYQVGAPTLAELRAINNGISDKHKALVEAHFETSQKVQGPAINKVSMDLFNYEIADPEMRHFHVSREQDIKAGTKADTVSSIDMAGRYQPRTGGTRRINIKPFQMEVLRGMQQDALFGTMTQSLQEAVTLVVNPKWRMAMKKAGQQKALTEITTMMKRVQGMTAEQSVLESEASKWLAGTAKSLLSLRPSGGLVQTASVPAAFEAIEPRYFANLKPITPKEIKHLEDIDPVLWLRWRGRQFDYATGLVGSQDAFESLVFEKTPLTSKGVALYTLGDQIAIGKIWHAAQNKVAKETNFKRGSKNFEAEALTHLHEGLKTQPQWDMLHRSSLTSHPNPMVRGFTMFMSARNAQYNVLLRAVNDYQKQRISEKEFETRIGGVALANVGVAMARRAAKIAIGTGSAALLWMAGMGPSEPDEEMKRFVTDQLEKVPTDTAFNVLGLNAFGGILTTIGYSAMDRIEHGSWEKADLSQIRSGNMIGDLLLDATEAGIDITVLTHQVMNNDPEWKQTAKDLADLLAQLVAYRYGLPWEGPKSDLIWPAKSATRDTTAFGDHQRAMERKLDSDEFYKRAKRLGVKP